jgi:hypothetical protein
VAVAVRAARIFPLRLAPSGGSFANFRSPKLSLKRMERAQPVFGLSYGSGMAG